MTTPGLFFGRILDQDGAPVDGAIFSTLHDSTISDAAGNFSIETDEMDGPQMVNRVGYDAAQLSPLGSAQAINDLVSTGEPVNLGTITIYRDDAATTFEDVNIYGQAPKKKYGLIGGLLFLGMLAAMATKKTR